MVRRWFVVVIAALLLFTGLDLIVRKATAHPAPVPVSGSGPVIVIGMPGLRWQDVSAEGTPQLWSLLELGAAGSVSVRATTTDTCTTTAWLSLSAGAPASAGSGASACDARKPQVRGHTARWPKWQEWQRDAEHGATLGLVGSTFAKHGRCVQAIGPGAALAAADRNGVVRHYTADVADADFSDCAASFVDLGGSSLSATMRSLNTVMGKVPADATVILTGLSDGAHPSGPGDAHLRLLYAVGPGVKRGELWSSSAKQPGFLQAADVTATVLARGTPKGTALPDGVTGRRLEVIPGKPDAAGVVQDGRDLDVLLTTQHRTVLWLYVMLGVLIAAAIAGEAYGWRRQDRSPRWVRPLATFISAVPVASFVSTWVPWWRLPAPGVWLLVATAAFAAVATGAAYAGPWRRSDFGPFAMVGVLTILTLALDVMNGTRLQLLGMLGLQPVLGGRYYGMGNVGFAVLATATLIVATAAAAHYVARGERRLAGASVLLLGLAVTAVDAAPMWGADLGGPPALIVATLVLAAFALGVRLTWRRVAAMVGAAVLIVIIAAFADWLRPEQSRTHLGRFVQQMIDGSGWSVIGDKLWADVTLVFGTPLTPFVPLLLIVVIVLLARPDLPGGRALTGVVSAVPFLREGVIALLTCWAIGFAINDSGVVIPTIGALLGIPLVVGAHTFREEKALTE